MVTYSALNACEYYIQDVETPRVENAGPQHYRAMPEKLGSPSCLVTKKEYILCADLFKTILQCFVKL